MTLPKIIVKCIATVLLELRYEDKIEAKVKIYILLIYIYIFEK